MHVGGSCLNYKRRDFPKPFTTDVFAIWVELRLLQACWSSNGNQILAGRRNGTIDIWDVRHSNLSASSSSSQTPRLLTTLRTPAESGPISCVVPFPDGRHVATASTDNVRLWNTVEYLDSSADEGKKRSSKPPFKIIAGHHGGTISSMRESYLGSPSPLFSPSH